METLFADKVPFSALAYTVISSGKVPVKSAISPVVLLVCLKSTLIVTGLPISESMTTLGSTFMITQLSATAPVIKLAGLSLLPHQLLLTSTVPLPLTLTALLELPSVLRMILLFKVKSPLAAISSPS